MWDAALHSSITKERVNDAAKEAICGDENIGFCAACGEEDYECEPDAYNLTCSECGKTAVFGIAHFA